MTLPAVLPRLLEPPRRTREAMQSPAVLPLPIVGIDSDPWLTLQQGAAIVQAHEATLRREIRRGRLRAARVGGRKSIRLRRSWLDAWLEANTSPIEVRP